MTILTATNLTLLYGEVEIFAGVDLQVDDGARIGVVGPNGGGKTSLIRILAGELEPNGGSVSRTRGLRLGYVPQTPAMLDAQDGDGEAVGETGALNSEYAGSEQRTLRDEVMEAFARLRRIEDELAVCVMDMQSQDDAVRRHAERRYDALQQEYEAGGGYDYLHRMERVLNGVGLQAHTLDTPAAVASGGERTRAALAKALLSDPDFLILDEPTNYLDFKGLDWLEAFLLQFNGGFIVVSHDRYFLDKVATQIFEMDMGRLQAFPGNYTKYRTLKDEQLRRQQIEYERQQEYIAREEAFIRRYRAGQRAREARGRATRLERLERIEKPQSNEPIRVQNVSANRTGYAALRTNNLVVGYRENGRDVRLLTVVDTQLTRGSRTAVIGSNGVGKTTLVQTMLGFTPALAGSVRQGHNVAPGYYSQGSTDMPEQASVIDALLDARNLPLPEARNYLARFLFRGDDVFKSTAVLSGGERSRLALARLLITEPNMLVLDEPTTHLDIPSREALEAALLAYAGTLIFVSHDRRLISLLATQLWVVEDGAVRLFNGNFDAWMRQSHTRESAGNAKSARTPHRENHAATQRKRSARQRRHSAAQQRQRQAIVRDHENHIEQLERRLTAIDAELQAASERQDVGEVTRLGERYTATQERLEQAWNDWNALVSE